MGELLFTLLQLWYIVERCECDVYPFWMLRVWCWYNLGQQFYL